MFHPSCSFTSTGFGIMNDFWTYSVSTGRWTWVNGSNMGNTAATYGTQGVGHPDNTPGARYNSVSWTDNQGRFWVFGGANAGSSRLNDLWMAGPDPTSAASWTLYH